MFTYTPPSDAYLKDPSIPSKARSLLRSMNANSLHIEAAALVTYDGLILASVKTEEIDADRFGAMCASLLALANRATQEAQRGDLRQIILDGALGPMLLSKAGEVGVLVVAASSAANLGKVIMDTRATAKSLAELNQVHGERS